MSTAFTSRFISRLQLDLERTGLTFRRWVASTTLSGVPILSDAAPSGGRASYYARGPQILHRIRAGVADRSVRPSAHTGRAENLLKRGDLLYRGSGAATAATCRACSDL